MENKPPFFVCSLSGGKDSTAMLLRLLEENRPVDMILFCDTGLEFPDMYSHLGKLEKYIGRPITRIKAEHNFDYYFSEVPIKRGNPEKFREQFGGDYNGYGWMGPKMRWCTNSLKDQPREQILRSLREKYNIYNGPRNPDHSWKKDRERGRINKSKERGSEPWHEQCTARNLKQNWCWRY